MEKGQGERTDTLQTDKVFTRKEYIEREAAISVIAKISNESDMPEDWHKGMSVAMSAVCRIPAADVVPVRHGRWVTKKDACGRDYTICSACETEIKWRDRRGVMLIVDMQNAPYCPNCGARMDGDGE